ncbi:hypothetical protein Pmar_PMAR011679 [Perkinsus marinus ATCC 50983]|uniref:Uncharacterized protein n=1 Tax=Perkinsus marinus (strain ATCC 50983 / TXsc) TaxID=423536 RepID=C5LCG8_PERM5|nr:hypothetical protein Pmar_PMAR011679 [Perkinsus marinus ATCC 50983]EER05651.1 hypothetical protein Pmar_PMAR011679 [Perkinsus marinus ATCC 50983]|eukprot:XP_002773835.1 hypothetical protein Pmar_PMAR011679 [Perkinsus marinus ATCC 50983]
MLHHIIFIFTLVTEWGWGMSTSIDAPISTSIETPPTDCEVTWESAKDTRKVKVEAFVYTPKAPLYHGKRSVRIKSITFTSE